MGMFLWTVGSSYVFGKTLDLTWFYRSDSTVLRRHRFPLYCLLAKIHHAKVGKFFYCFEIPMLDALLFFEIVLQIQVHLNLFRWFRWISGTPRVESLATCGNLWQRAAAHKGRLQAPILQVWGLGGLDPGGLQAWSL